MQDTVDLDGPPYDARSVSNLLLQYGREQGAPLSNLSLQKVLYFAHGLYLTRYGKPLVEGYFEAWENGPVHPLVYHAFKSHGANAIEGFAARLDLRTRTRLPVEAPLREEIRHFIREVARTYGRMSPGQLVGWSHRKNAPWEAVVGSGPDRTSRFGLRIENSLISERFGYHRLAVADPERGGEIREELPPATD
jgi:uncharacterized phage-associated protein